MNWWQIVTGILLIISVITAGGVSLKWRQTKHVLKDVAKMLTDVSNAIEDDNVSQAELDQILKDGTEVIEAAKELAGK